MKFLEQSENTPWFEHIALHSLSNALPTNLFIQINRPKRIHIHVDYFFYENMYHSSCDTQNIDTSLSVDVSEYNWFFRLKSGTKCF